MTRSFRLLLLAGLIALTILAGLSPTYAACGSATTVSNETELNDAIADFNGEAGPCAYEIEFDADILLTNDLTQISNNNAGVSLLIDGAGFTLDGDNSVGALNIFNTPEVTIEDLTVTGSIFNGIESADSDLSVFRSTIRNSGSDGIDFNDGDLVVVESTLAENSGAGFDGYTIDGPTTVTIVNSTIADNDNNVGFIFGITARLTHVTAAGNSGGLYIDNSTVTIDNSILSNGLEDCINIASTVDVNFSLVQSDSPFAPCGLTDGVDGNIVGEDPLLAPLGDYGGPTQTRPPIQFAGAVTTGSPAIDAGDDALSDDENGAPLTTDQRGAGFPRVILPEADMGAVEGAETITCATSVMSVANETDLDEAILCYNNLPGPAAYAIEFAADVTLTGDVLLISNPDVTLFVNGAGHTLDGDTEFGAFIVTESADTIFHEITVIDAVDDGIDSDYTNIVVSRSTIQGSDSDAIEFYTGELTVFETTLLNNFDNAIDADSDGSGMTLTVFNSTMIGNGFDEGAPALLLSEPDLTATLTNVTVVNNSAGLEVDDSNVTVNNSILAGNDDSDCLLFDGTIDVNFSLVQNDDEFDPCGVSDGVDGNITGENPFLAPLGDYGGPTLTRPPLQLTGGVTGGSPVINEGDQTLSVDDSNQPLTTDQRGAGFPRVIPPEADMGAVEGPLVINCDGFPVTVDDETELAEAIVCYNGITTAGTYTINLGDDIDLTVSPPAIDNDTIDAFLLVEGNGNTIDGQGMFGVRPITVAADTNVIINEATITGGHTNDDGGGGIYNAGLMELNEVVVEFNTTNGNGGGIYNETSGAMEIHDSAVDNNTAAFPDGDGGGIDNAGNMVITDSTVNNNTTDGDFFVTGGGILNDGDLDVIRSTVADNTITGEEEVFGGGIANQANLVIRDSTISGNEITAEFDALGGGIYSEPDEGAVFDEGFIPLLLIVNSTISGNTVAGDEDVYGGGLYATDDCCFDDPVPVKLINTTVADNTVTANDFFGGGGAYFDQDGDGLTVTIHNSILALNSTGGDPGGDCQSIDEGDLAFESLHSLYEDTGDGACGLAAANPDADGNIVGEDPNIDPLGNNGGPTQTHLPDDTSAAIDAGDNDLALDEQGNPLEADQRGFTPRVVNGTVDMGAVEVGAEGPEGDAAIFMSTTAAGTTGDGQPFGPEDILEWGGSGWSLWFNGSTAGLMPSGNAKHNINAFWIPDTGGPDVVMSFTQNARIVPGIGPEKVDGMDLVWWDGSAFSLWFDGNDVALTNKTQEKIDGLHVLPGSESPIGGGCIAYLLISTQGPGKVPNYSGGTLKFSGEDVLGFCMTNSGSSTTGLWHMVLDGSAQGMPKNATDSISLSADGETLYLTTKGTFVEDAASGGHSMVYAYDFGSPAFSGPLFDAPAEGLPKKVDGLQVAGELP